MSRAQGQGQVSNGSGKGKGRGTGTGALALSLSLSLALSLSLYALHAAYFVVFFATSQGGLSGSFDGLEHAEDDEKSNKINRLARMKQKEDGLWGFDMDSAIQGCFDALKLHETQEEGNFCLNMDHVVNVSALSIVATTNVHDLSCIQEGGHIISDLLCYCFRVQFELFGGDFEVHFGALHGLKQSFGVPGKKYGDMDRRVSRSVADSAVLETVCEGEPERVVLECIDATISFLYNAVVASSNHGCSSFLKQLLECGLIEILIHYMGTLKLSLGASSALFSTVALLLGPSMHFDISDEVYERIAPGFGEILKVLALKELSHELHHFNETSLMAEVIKIMMYLVDIGRRITLRDKIVRGGPGFFAKSMSREMFIDLIDCIFVGGHNLKDRLLTHEINGLFFLLAQSDEGFKEVGIGGWGIGDMERWLIRIRTKRLCIIYTYTDRT